MTFPSCFCSYQRIYQILDIKALTAILCVSHFSLSQIASRALSFAVSQFTLYCVRKDVTKLVRVEAIILKNVVIFHPFAIFSQVLRHEGSHWNFVCQPFFTFTAYCYCSELSFFGVDSAHIMGRRAVAQWKESSFFKRQSQPSLPKFTCSYSCHQCNIFRTPTSSCSHTEN